MCAFASSSTATYPFSPPRSISQREHYGACRIAIICLISLILLLLTGCIHTYPTPEEAINPTEIDVELTVKFAEDWTDIHALFSENTSEATRAENWPRRLYMELTGNDGKKESITRVIEPQEILGGVYTFTLPFKLKAQEYEIALWSDYLDPETLQPMGYDISHPDLIRELLPRGEETQRRMCLTAADKLDLTHLAGEWNATEKVNLTLTLPIARFRLVATDYEEFMAHTEQNRKHGEKYYVSLSYDSEIPGGFSMLEGAAMDPVSGANFSTPLLALTIPGIEMSIASDWLFNPSARHTHTVSVSILNSAKAIVSQTVGINIPTERGKITTVSGKFLTNFITGGIQIDNIWAGEIIIEIE